MDQAIPFLRRNETVRVGFLRATTKNVSSSNTDESFVLDRRRQLPPVAKLPRLAQKKPEEALSCIFSPSFVELAWSLHRRRQCPFLPSRQVINLLSSAVARPDSTEKFFLRRHDCQCHPAKSRHEPCSHPHTLPPCFERTSCPSHRRFCIPVAP